MNESSTDAILADAHGRSLFELVVEPGIENEIKSEQLRSQIESSIESFQSLFAKLTEPVKIFAGGSGCLRTGYNFERKAVQFCRNLNTPAAGTSSVDVVHHEMFHAMLCQIRPQWCTAQFLKDRNNIAMHEALADLFAYSLNPDDSFGEGFYSSSPRVRFYRSDECYSLTESPYAKASALVDFVLRNEGRISESVVRLIQGTSFESKLLGTDKEPCFRKDGPSLEFEPMNYPHSALSRFKISADKPLVFRVNANKEFERQFPNNSVEWVFDSGLFSAQVIDGGFKISPVATQGWTKAKANIFAGQRLAGTKTFYFSVLSDKN
jgi:hypothetical protein